MNEQHRVTTEHPMRWNVVAKSLAAFSEVLPAHVGSRPKTAEGLERLSEDRDPALNRYLEHGAREK